MIQEIGIMIGAYIAIRMFQILFPQKDEKHPVFIQILAGILIACVVVIPADIIMKGTGIGKDLTSIFGL